MSVSALCTRSVLTSQDQRSPSAQGKECPRGRMAPSPTGLMHLGNAWSFLMAWLSIRQQDGTMVLRMEDIDPDRAKTHFANAIMYDLAWLGLSWDEGPVPYEDVYETVKSTPCATDAQCLSHMQGAHAPYAPYIQSQCADLYIAALDYLESQGHSYPCFCTRKELRAMAGAPHFGEACVYAGTCRHLTKAEQAKRLAEGRKACIRLRCPDTSIAFTDRRCGLQNISLTWCGGDFAIRRSDGVFAYQLAVVIDDMRMGITDIVRGDDLLHCTPRQIFLQSLLRQSDLPFFSAFPDMPTPSYLHVPLLLDAEGERFAKRHASLTIQSLREAGIPASCVLGYLAYLAGFINEYTPISADELVEYFSVQKLPKTALRLMHDPFQAMHDLAHVQEGATTSLTCEPCGPVLASSV